MAEPVRLSLDEAEALARQALVSSRTSAENAGPTARALVAAEADGQAGHGLSRVPSYALQARAGKVDGHAIAARSSVSRARHCASMAAIGFAYPAIDAGDRGTRAAGTRTGHRRRGHPPLASFRPGRRTCRATRRARARRAGARQLAEGHGLLGRPQADARHQPARLCRTAAGWKRRRWSSTSHMSVAARGKIVAAEKAGKPIPARLGRRRGRPTRPPTRKPPSAARCCRSAAPRAARSH